jgi:hypothetical protein
MTADDRRAALIAAALAGELDPAERRELDELRRLDPALDHDLAAARRASDGLAGLGDWSERPSPALRDRVLAFRDEPAAADDGADPAAAAHRATALAHRAGPAQPTERLSAPAPAPALPDLRDRRPRRIRVTAAVLGAAAALVVGGAVGGLVGALAGSAPTGGGDPSGVTGPPGTLGAVEAVDFRGEPSGSRIDGSVVAHTWGTETVLEVDGLDPAADYGVVVIGVDGRRVDSGGFVGSTVTVDCRVNAALLREDVAAIEIEDAEGDVVAAADLPRVG